MASITPERRASLDKERAKNSSRGNFYSVKNLQHDIIRLVPLGEDEPIATKVVSYFLNNKSYVCNEETHSKPGVISKTKRALARLGDDEEAQLAFKAIDDARRGKYLMKIIARSNPEQVKWFEAPRAIYQAVFNVLDKDGEEISNAKEGRDVRWSKADGTGGRNVKYECRVLDQSLLHKDKAVRIAIREQAAKMRAADIIAADEEGALSALQEIIPPHIWKKIRSEVLGAKAAAAKESNDDDADADAGGDDEEERPAKKKAAASNDDADDEKPAKKAPAAQDDDDLDEDPKPAKKKAAAASADEDADDDDLDDEKPKKGAKAVSNDEDDEQPKAAKNKKAYEVSDADDD